MLSSACRSIDHCLNKGYHQAVSWFVFTYVVPGPQPSGPPSIPKLSFTEVNDIPLVLYIPAAPESSSPPREDADPNEEPDTDSKSIHRYPPAPSFPPRVTPATPSKKKGWFAFLFKKPAPVHLKDDVEKAAGGAQDPWEAMWEKGRHPFVQLESHRAACPICLDDYEEPKRVANAGEDNSASPAVESTAPGNGTHAVQSSSGSVAEPQPLRLLNCGHVFHVSCTVTCGQPWVTRTDCCEQRACVDMWLMEKAGRCPSCQCPARPQKKQKKRS